MKKLSTVLLASTLVVSMVSPASVFARENKVEELVKEKVEKTIDDAKEKHDEKKAEKAEEKAAKDEKKAAKDLAEGETKKAEKEEEKAKKEEKKEEKEEAKLDKLADKKEIKIVVSPQKVTLDGKEVKIHGYNINGHNFYKLRDLAAVLKDTEAKFAVEYKAPAKDQKTGEVVLVPGKKYEPLKTDLQELKSDVKGSVSNDVVKIGDKNLVAESYKIDGHNYYKLRDLGAELNFGVNYDKKTNTVLLTSKVEKETVKEEVKEDAKKAEEKVEDAKKEVKENTKAAAKELEKQADKSTKQNPQEK